MQGQETENKETTTHEQTLHSHRTELKERLIKLEEVRQLFYRNASTGEREFRTWKQEARKVIERIFGTETKLQFVNDVRPPSVVKTHRIESEMNSCYVELTRLLLKPIPSCTEERPKRKGT